MESTICDLLGIKYPIIQGGMAWIAEHKLASAVSEAGGLGIIAAGGAPADAIREQIIKARELTKKPIGVNIMLLSPFVEDIAELVIEQKVEVVTTGAGSPAKYIEKWKAAGIKVLPVVASVALARKMEKMGADAVICEGQEAGGHIGESTTMTLVPQVADAVSIPVIAAGGIADARGMAASFILGAQAVQCGTVFLATNECIISDKYKDLVLSATDISTVVTSRSTGHPVRCIKSPLAREMMKMEKDGASFDELEKISLGSLRKAVLDGNFKEGSFMSGQIAGMVSEIKPCKTVIEEMYNGALKILKG